MAFIRTKKIKGKKYAYIVENKWCKQKVKQKVKKYLGRVYTFKRTETESDFERFVSKDIAKYTEERDAKNIILDLVRWELCNHGFKDNEGLIVKDGCVADLKKIKIRNNSGACIALELNEGLLNEYKLKQFLKFDFGTELSEHDAAYLLAKEFVENGIKVPHDVFVAVFEKLFK